MKISEQEKVDKLILGGVKVRKIAKDLKIPRSEIQKRANELKKGGSKKILVSIIIVIAVIFSIWFFNTKPSNDIKKNPQHTESEEPWLKNTKSVCDQILSTKKDDEWLVETEQISNPDVIPHMIEVSKKITKQIESGLQENCSIPEVKELKKTFAGKLTISYFSGASGGSTQLFSTDKPLSSQLKGQEIAFYGKSDTNNARINNQLLFYYQDWGALIIAGIKWDKIWLEAVVLHELYHAKMFKDNSPSSTAQPMSDVFIKEEIAAHNLEHNILNLQTSGKYNKTVQEIIDSKKITSQEELMEQITVNDIKKLDGLFETAGSRETSIRLTQFYFSLLSNWIDQKFKEEKILQEKIRSYKLITSV